MVTISWRWANVWLESLGCKRCEKLAIFVRSRHNFDPGDRCICANLLHTQTVLCTSRDTDEHDDLNLLSKGSARYLRCNCERKRTNNVVYDPLLWSAYSMVYTTLDIHRLLLKCCNNFQACFQGTDTRHKSLNVQNIECTAGNQYLSIPHTNNAFDRLTGCSKIVICSLYMYNYNRHNFDDSVPDLLYDEAARAINDIEQIWHHFQQSLADGSSKLDLGRLIDIQCRCVYLNHAWKVKIAGRLLSLWPRVSMGDTWDSRKFCSRHRTSDYFGHAVQV